MLKIEGKELQIARVKNMKRYKKYTYWCDSGTQALELALKELNSRRALPAYLVL